MTVFWNRAKPVSSLVGFPQNACDHAGRGSGLSFSKLTSPGPRRSYRACSVDGPAIIPVPSPTLRNHFESI